MNYHQNASPGGVMVVRRRLLALFAVVAVASGLLAAVVVKSNGVSSLVSASSTVAAARTAPRTVHWQPVPYHHLRVKLIPRRRLHGRSDKDLARRAGAYARTHDARDHGPLGAHLLNMSRKAHTATQAARLTAAVEPIAGSGSNNKVLILDSTVTGGMNSIEAQEATAQGYGVDIVNATQWSAMTADQFAAYRAIILGDPTCQTGESAVAAAEANATTWGPVINGDIEIIGSDPIYHATYTNPAIAAVTQRAVDFAAAQSGKTGAYISLSCYFHGVATQTHVSLLDGLDPGGTGFSVQGVGCSDSIHIEATSPALSGIDDNLLSNWECSVHEAFDSWPSKFGVLAVDTNAGSLYTGQDGTTGDPYILAFPGGKFQGTTETAGGGSLTGHTNQPCTGWPVNCATGEFWHTFDDLTVPGRGPALNLTRTYSSLRASTDSPFGSGWSSAYTMSLAVDSASGAVQVTQENGSTTVFSPSGGGYAAPPRVYATLTKNADGTWTYIRHQRQRFTFDANGRLSAISDLNGYTTTLSYDGSGQLTTVTDPAGRTLSFTYGSNGKIAKVTDPAGRSVTYTYDSNGNLTGTTDVAGGTRTFAYDAAHLMTSMTDPRGGTVANVYDATGKVTKQTDAAGRATTFAYDASGTTITKPNGNVTAEGYTQGQLVTITRGAGTASAATWKYTYDAATLGLATSTDPNGHTTTYAYDSGSYYPTSVTDALGRVTKRTYNTFEEPLTVTDPAGTTTTYAYDASGNLKTVSRPLTGSSSTQTTSLGYGDSSHPGDITDVTDPNGKDWQFGYDGPGDLASITDPLGHKTSYSYDSIGRRTSMVSPRGNATGSDPASFTTSYAYDAFGDVTKITDPLGHVTTFGYDPNRNRTSLTDANGNRTSYAYNADDELSTTTRADGTSLSYSHDGDGNQTSQTDAAGHTTSFGYDPLNRVISSTDPLGRTTSFGYDGAGNRTSLTDPSGRITTFAYDAANEPTAIHYSDGKTPNVTYTYDTDGQRTGMSDGTGTSQYAYDSLNRLTSTTNGAGAKVSYGYDLAGQLTSLTYPNGKTVTRSYDPAGQLASVTDWLGNTTSFGHDPDSNLTTEAYPNGVKTAASFDKTDQVTSITDTNGATNLASFSYTRDNLGQVTSDTPAGATGTAQTYGYTSLNQLASLNKSPYGYDNADNLVKLADGTTQTFDAANELTSSTRPASSPTVDQVVSADQKTAATTISSPVVKTTSGNELVLAFVSEDGPAASKQKISAVTGGGLTWSLATRAIDGRGTAEVWQAYATAPISAAITATVANGRFDGSITVATFTGAAHQVGAAAGRTAASATAPSVTLKTTQPGSLVWAAGLDGDHATAITPVTGQTLVHQYLDTRVDRTYWAQKTADPIAASGTSVTISDTAPTADRWELAAVEIPAASGTAASGVPTSYQYDKQGNRTTITPSGGTSMTLSYDQANRLTAYGTTATYTYDGDGLRASKTVGASTTAFTWEQSGQLPLLLANGGDFYVYGENGTPIEKISGTTVIYLHQDQQGSTRLLTDASGSVVGTYSYDPYGNVTSHTGSATSALQYDGQYTDAESGYQYLRARYYDPAAGQFISVDPMALLTRASYAYAADNPTTLTDPSGLWPCLKASCLIKDVAIGAAVVGVAAAVVALAPEVTVATVVTVTAEEATAVVLTDAGVVAVDATIVTATETAITSTAIAEGVGAFASGVGYAAATAKVFDTCWGGRSPECTSALEELGQDIGFGAVGRILRSSGYEFFNSLRELYNAIYGDSRSGGPGFTC
jgi:RHS repeat-associated protein